MLRIIPALAILCFFLFASAGICAAQSIYLPVGQEGGWKLTFQDEFEGTSLDLAKWSAQDIWCGVRNNELQAYVPQNAEVSGGLLRLIAEKSSANYGYCGQPSIVKTYASGIAITKDKFDQKYGYFEARCKVPKGNGLWPAFWLLPYGKWPPEIDIMEVLSEDPTKAYMTNHWGTPSTHQQNSGTYTGTDFSSEFHVFGAKWSEDEIVWYIDGVQRFRSTSGIPQERFHILLNLAVGGNWPRPPDASTPFPSELQVDYVRVWKYLGPCANECPAIDAKNCSGNGYNVCGDYNSDGCLEWSNITDCLAGQACQNGQCISNKSGSVIDSPDTCVVNLPCMITVRNCSDGLLLVRNQQGRPINISQMVMSGDFPLTFFSLSPYQRSFTASQIGIVSVLELCFEGTLSVEKKEISLF